MKHPVSTFMLHQLCPDSVCALSLKSEINESLISEHLIYTGTDEPHGVCKSDVCVPQSPDGLKLCDTKMWCTRADGS